MEGAQIMRTISVIVPANDSNEIGVAGDYVRVKQATGDIRVENPEASEIVEAGQGDDFQFTPFHSLKIYNDTASDQTVKLTVSRGKKAGSAQVGGSVTISGALALDVATLAALESVDLNTATLNAITAALADVGLAAETYTNTYFTDTAFVAGTVVTVISAASNTNGVDLIDFSISAYNATTPTWTALAKTSAPTTKTDGDTILAVEQGHGTTNTIGKLNVKTRIPAGKGLYIYPITAASAVAVKAKYVIL